MRENKMVSVLFVCTGNICRSPTAEAVFRHRARQYGLDNIIYDSAGMHGYHVGEVPDERAIATAEKNGVDMSGIYARKFEWDDFLRFDYILAMDRGHESEINAIRPDNTLAVIGRLLDFDAEYRGQDVPDPYYGSSKDFDRAYYLIERGIDSFINCEILKEMSKAV